MVSQESALLPGYNAIGIQADHREMVRFKYNDDPGFVLIVGELLRWVRRLKDCKEETQQGRHLETHSAPELSANSYINEDGSLQTLPDDLYYEDHELFSEERSPQEVEGQIIAMLGGGSSIPELDVPTSNRQPEEPTVEPLKIANRQNRRPISITDTDDDALQYDKAGREAHTEGKWELAVRMFESSIDGKERQLPKDVISAESRKLYAEALLETKMYRRAEAQSRLVLMWTEKNSDNKDLMNQARQTLASALEKRNQLEEAREQFEKAAIGFEAVSGGADSSESLSCRYRHGILASNHEAYDMSWPYWSVAETSLRRAAEGMSRLLGPHHKNTLMSKIGYAKVLLKTCRDREAYQEFYQALSIARRDLSENHPMVQDIMHDMNECKSALKRSRTSTAAESLRDARKKEQKFKERELRREITGHW